MTRRPGVRSSSLVTGGALLLVLAGVGALSTDPRAASTVTATPVHAVDPGTTADVVTEVRGPASAACGGADAPARPGGGHYRCAFYDDFPGRSLDTDKWLVQETWYSAMTSGNDDCYVNDRRNVAVRSGTLRLTSRRLLPPFTCESPSGDFTATSTAATVATRGRFTQTNGWFEFRARMPDVAVPGAHAALWLYPQQHSYGHWPKSGEIDVAEWFSGQPDKVYPSVHYEGENPWLSTGWWCVTDGPSASYHTYAVQWTPETMRFYYDGQLCHEHAWTPNAPLTAPQPFDQPFYVVLTEVWGAQWNAPTDQTPASATLHVDWVRVWR